MPVPQIAFRRSILTYIVGLALALILLTGLFWYFANQSIPHANAQIAQITTVIENASRPITGDWQTAADSPPGTEYQLWSYKKGGNTEGGIDYTARIFCYWYRIDVYDEDGNYIDINDITFDDQSHTTVQTFNSEGGAITIEAVIAGATTIKVENRASVQLYTDRAGLNPTRNPYRKRCIDLNVDPLENNLIDRDDYLTSIVPGEAREYGWLTGVNPVIWPESKSAILDQKPFLVLGNGKPGGGGFTNHSLDLSLWIPEDVDITSLELLTDNLCDNTDWDDNPDNAEISIYLEGQAGRVKIIDEDDCADNVHSLAGIDLSDVGKAFLKRSLTTASKDGSREQLYDHFKIKAELSDINTAAHHINQFSLTVSKPDNAYLVIGQTQRDRSGDYIAAKALSVSNRLPDEYDRLEIFWKTDIYLAADASKGCSGSETQNIGLYDSDYPTRAWSYFASKDPDMKPEVQIYSADRNQFLNGEITEIGDYEKHLFFDGIEDGVPVSQDAWEYGEMTFEYSKVYELRFRNIDQRTWIQIGLPYDQINALQKCVDKPLVKVYQSDISVGGRFGTGVGINNCRDDDLSLGDSAAGIYAHGIAGREGSSAEYAVYARGTIDAFYSKFKRNPAPPPNPIQQLTFANNDATSPWGGHWGGQLRCLSNYWRRAPELGEPLEDETLSLSHLSQNSETYYTPKPSGMLSLSAPSNNLDLKATVYIEGDLLITQDIINSNGNLKKFNEIQSIYLIVKGDIFIAPSVTKIDAVLVAMPDESHLQEGRIYTCYIDGLSAVDGIDLDSLIELQKKPPEKLKKENKRYAQECVKQLIINGALVARQIHLGRTTNSDSSSLGYATYPVSEEVNLPPEYFVGIPQLPAHSDWFYKSDSITILPVNF